MDRLIYTAMTGANAAANRQAVIANNLANVSTNGFRAQLATYRAVPLRGDGATTRVFALEATAGHLQHCPVLRSAPTARLDTMAVGDAWFTVQGLGRQRKPTPATATFEVAILKERVDDRQWPAGAVQPMARPLPPPSDAEHQHRSARRHPERQSGKPAGQCHWQTQAGGADCKKTP